ncbi:MAG: NUDIX domain-containing protein [Bdellovibrionia bacterium]
MSKRKVQVWVYLRNPKTLVYFFLILKTRPDRGGFWQPITGGVEKEENLAEAALREAQEETGIVYKEAPEPLFYEFEFESRGHLFTEHGFSLPIKALDDSGTLPAVKIDPKEHVEYQWVTAREAFKTIAHASNATMLKVLLSRLAKQ